MLATKITDHVQQALARLLEQYKRKPNIAAFYTAFIQQIQDEEDAIFALDETRQLYNGTTYPAVGAQLDGIGEIVGIDRNGLSDAEYLIFILGKIATNFSDATPPTVESITDTFFRPEQLVMHEFYPAEVDFEMAGVLLGPALWPIVFPLIQKSLGAGIKLGFVSVYDETNGFVIGDDFGNGDGGGFGDDLNPSVGGLIASDIYINSGD